VSNDAIMMIALCGGAALMVLFYLLPETIKSWHGSRAKAAKAEVAAMNAALKRDMVAKGFSAEEIARVMNAGNGPEPADEKPAA
jgi:hypothetical protein